MENTNKISAVIITFNEEKNIRRCLDSLDGIVDEIIVVDSYSKDKTEEICKQKGVTFIQNSFEGHIQQKNFAMNKANNNYVISLDADEALNDTLKNNILSIKENLSAFDAYSFNRLTNYCGQWIKHCGWYPDKKIRIWNKNKGKWGGINPHDKVIMQSGSTVKHLPGDLLHYSYYTVRQHVQQAQYFSDIGAKAALEAGKKSSILKILVKPSFRFFRGYFLKGGFLDGFYGLIICINASYENFLKYLKLYELQRNKLDY